ncbi:MAG: hypothetical protein R3316_03990 [Rhodovibrionaceae bacterium]|nr:hypothetical protein [Rhodovibrionaceae bacterium]
MVTPWRVLTAAPLLALALVGCAKSEPPAPAAAWQIEATLVGEQRETVEVSIFGLEPAESVESIRLVGPAGESARPVETLEHKRITGGDTLAQPRISVGVLGGSSGHVRSGVGIAVPVFTKRDSGRGVEEGKEVVARIPIPDPESYQRSAAGWRIEIIVGNALGERQVRTLPAPRP